MRTVFIHVPVFEGPLEVLKIENPIKMNKNVFFLSLKIFRLSEQKQKTILFWFWDFGYLAMRKASIFGPFVFAYHPQSLLRSDQNRE